MWEARVVFSFVLELFPFVQLLPSIVLGCFVSSGIIVRLGAGSLLEMQTVLESAMLISGQRR